MFSVKNRVVFASPFALLLAAFILSSCGGHGGLKQHIEVGNNRVDYEPASNTKVLASPSISIIKRSATSTFISGASTPFKIGQVLASSIGDGVYGRVTGVSAEPGGQVVETEVLPLNEAFKNLSIHLEDELDQSNLQLQPSTDPAVDITWEDSPTARPGLKNVLKVLLKHFKVRADCEVSGTIKLNFNPVLDLTFADTSALIDPVQTFNAGLRPQITAQLEVTNKYGGGLQFEEEYGSIDLGKVRYGPFVFYASVDLKAVASGSIGGQTKATYAAGASGVAMVSYERDRGWSFPHSFVPVTGASYDKARGTGSFKITPIEAELRFDLYGIAGPFASLGLEFEAKAEPGVCEAEENKPGTKVHVGCDLVGSVGVGTNFPGFLGEHFDASASTQAFKIEISEIPLPKDCFPYEGQASFAVGDNGPAPDDIFEVVFDGSFLGTTTRGGTGQFALSDISPGNHSLRITCLDDGAGGTDIGTLGVTLGQGATFTDGGTTLSARLPQGESIDLTVVAPDSPSATTRRVPLKLTPNLAVKEKPTRLQ